MRRTVRRLIGEHDYFLKGNEVALSGNEVKRASPAYHKKKLMGSTENWLGTLFYSQTSEKAKTMRNMCRRLKGLGRLKSQGDASTACLGSKTAFQGERLS